MAPVAGDLPCVCHSDSASSDPGLAVKGKFAAKHLLMSSLFSWSTWFITGPGQPDICFPVYDQGQCMISSLCFLSICSL